MGSNNMRFTGEFLKSPLSLSNFYGSFPGMKSTQNIMLGLPVVKADNFARN